MECILNKYIREDKCLEGEYFEWKQTLEAKICFRETYSCSVNTLEKMNGRIYSESDVGERFNTCDTIKSKQQWSVRKEKQRYEQYLVNMHISLKTGYHDQIRVIRDISRHLPIISRTLSTKLKYQVWIPNWNVKLIYQI